MFTNIDNDVVGFNSYFYIEKNVNESSTQTTEFSTSDISTSPSSHQSINSQTDHQEVVINESTPTGLGKWLQKIAPMVLKEMEMNQSSLIFRGYDPYTVNKKEEIKATLLQTLDVKSIDKLNESYNNSATDNVKIPVSGLSWSSAGSTLAVTCGYLYHTDWCQHDGYLHIYSIRGREEEMKHLHHVKASSCIISVIFHPSDPALLATTSFSGEISIWNLQYLHDGTNRDILISSNSDLHSGKMVPCVLWLNAEQINKYFSTINNASLKVLISAGSDSKVIVWIVDTTTSTLSMHTCYDIRSSTPERIEYSPDICSMDFCKIWDPIDESNEFLYTYDRKYSNDYFAVGCRTGEILLCKTLLAKFSQNPVTGCLQSHNACILSLKFCSVRSRILLTLGADREIRIYDILKNSPIHSLFLDCELSSVSWLPNCDTHVLGAVSHPSQIKNVSMLQVLSIITKNKIPIEGFIDQEKYTSGLSTLAINNKYTNRLASGDMSGVIKIWSVPFKEIVG